MEGTDGVEGTDGGVPPPDVYVAAKPLASTEPSAVNCTCMLPDVAVIDDGKDEPLRLGTSCGAPVLVPSYTFTKS